VNKLVCGRMKQGKTTLAMYLARERGFAIVAWDPRNMIQGDVVCWGPEQLQDAIEAIKAGELAHDAVIVYRFDSTDVHGEFNAMCAVLFPPMFTFGSFSLVVDEAAQLQKSNWILPSFDRAIRQHPRSVDIYQTTHSLQDFYRSSRDNVTDLYTFSLMGKSLESVVDFTEGDDETKQMIRGLDNHWYAHWNHATNVWEECEPIQLSPIQISNKPLTEAIQ
jgi:hypothetical protein